MRERHRQFRRLRHARLTSRLTIISLVTVVLALAGMAVASTLTTGEVGPSLRLTANGRLLHPAGRLTAVGNFPTGSALAAGGHALWVTDCGHGKDDVKVVNLSTGNVIQTLALPGCYGGVTFAPGGGTAYVGGTPKGGSPTEGPTKGDQGDVVHVFKVNRKTGTGKGFGSGPNPTYYFGGARTPLQTPPNAYGTYVLDLLIGRVGSLPVPTDRQIAADSAIADAQARPDNPEARPVGSPIPAAPGQPSAKIKHVFYIVRENRTYDQIFGTDPRGDGNAKLELFDDNGVSGPTGGITPNAHALARQFPLLDHFYEDSEVSVDGHIVTASAYATDYAQKATAANYSNRRGTYDFGIFQSPSRRSSSSSTRRRSRTFPSVTTVNTSAR